MCTPHNVIIILFIGHSLPTKHLYVFTLQLVVISHTYLLCLYLLINRSLAAIELLNTTCDKVAK